MTYKRRRGDADHKFPRLRVKLRVHVYHDGEKSWYVSPEATRTPRVWVFKDKASLVRNADGSADMTCAFSMAMRTGLI